MAFSKRWAITAAAAGLVVCGGARAATEDPDTSEPEARTPSAYGTGTAEGAVSGLLAPQEGEGSAARRANVPAPSAGPARAPSAAAEGDLGRATPSEADELAAGNSRDRG